MQVRYLATPFYLLGGCRMAAMTSFARVCKLGKPDFEIMVLHAQNTGHNINRIILDMQKNLSNYIQAINYRTTAALS